MQALAFSPDDQILASAGDDGVVRLWDPQTGTPTASLEAHTDWVRALAFRPDGQILASAGGDRVVRLWDPTRSEAVLSLQVGGASRALAWASAGIALAIERHVALLELVSWE